MQSVDIRDVVNPQELEDARRPLFHVKQEQMAAKDQLYSGMKDWSAADLGNVKWI